MIRSIFNFKRNTILLSVLLLTFLTSISVLGAVNISSDRTQVPLNEAFRVRVEFTDESMENFSIDGLENFNVMGRSTSKNISIINFKKMSQETEDYLLRPKKTGTFPLQVKTKKGVSNTISIEVTGNGSGAVNVPAISGKSSSAISPNGSGAVQNSNYAMITSFGENSKRKFYFGEKFIFSETFLAFRSPRDFRITKGAEFPDFTEKNLTPLGRGGTIAQSIIDYNGRQALEMPLYLGILQANSSGKKVIHGFEAQILDTSYQYYGGNSYDVEILPLPQGKPSNFKDIVGKLQISSNFSKTEASVGEPVALNIKLFGDVNLDNIEKLDIPANDDFTIYESMKNGKEDIVNGSYYAEKDFEIAFIPKKSGELRTPEIKISYLNSSNGKYEEKIILSQTIVVKETAASQSQQEQSSGYEEAASQSASGKGSTSENSISKPVSTDGVTVDFVVEDNNSKKMETRDYIIGALGVLNLLLILTIIYIFNREKIKGLGKTKDRDYLKEMRKAKSDEDFYIAYCSYMKSKYGFNPKIHSEIKLKNSDLIEINRMVEESRFRGTSVDRDFIVKKLKSC